MASLSATIADALKTDIDAQSWPVTLTTAREYLRPLARADMGAAKRVSVFPVRLRMGNVSRGGTEREHGIAVVLRAAVNPATTADVDALVETVEALADRYQKQAIGEGTPSSVEFPAGDTIYDPEAMAEDQAFIGGIIITYSTRT